MTVDVCIAHPDELFIGGAWTKPLDPGRRVEVVNPSTEAVIADLVDPGPADADAAVFAGRRGFAFWSGLSVEERTTALRRFTDALLAHTPVITRTWSAECGATAGWGVGVHEMAFPLMVGSAYQVAASTPLSEMRSSPFGPALVEREPYGVALAIITYNAPMMYVAFKVLPALLAGNVVILKGPPETRLVAQLIALAAEEADLPPGVLSVLTAGTETSRHLVEHPDVDVVSFTGGTTVGTEIVRTAAGRLAKVVLELGGKSAGIVADDQPIEELLPLVLPGLLPFQGQVCVALSRLLVSRARHDEVVGALAAAFGAVTIGDVADPAVDFGPVATSRTRDRCEAFVAEAVAAGATIAAGGRRPFDKGWFYEPTLLTGVTNDMRVAQEEVFGPVFTVIEYDDIDDAVAIANDSRYGLTAAIFTNDADLAMSVARRVRVGSFTTNSIGGVPGHPFGGYKMSGLGREMGVEGYLEWLQPKSIGLPGRAEFMGS
jgi:betaine-aldehyde dehydrogenase